MPNKYFFCSQRKIRKSTQTKKYFLHIFHKNVMHIEVDILSKIVLHSWTKKVFSHGETEVIVNTVHTTAQYGNYRFTDMFASQKFREIKVFTSKP